MKIQKTEKLNFSAKVDKNLISRADKFYTKRNLIIQRNQLDKFLDKFETYGSENSVILYNVVDDGNKVWHQLVLKNKDIKKKIGLILTTKDKFSDMLKYLVNITDQQMLNKEEELKNL